MQLIKAEKSILLLFGLFLLLPASGVNAQSDQIEMADTFRSEGKIYVVIICAFLVLTIMALYLLAIDKRISRLERGTADRKSND